MEKNEIKDAKKQFSKIGLILFLGTLLILTVQMLAMEIASNVPAIASNGSLSFVIGMLPMYIIGYPIVFLMFKKVPVQISSEKKKMRPLHLLTAFLMCYAATCIFNMFANILTTIIGIIKQSPVDNVMQNVTSNINPLANFLIIVICAPIMEELLFRKAIIDRTAKYGEGVAIIFSGLVFGLFHGNLVQFSYAFFVGAFFGFIYLKTKNIAYPIILHILVNFVGSFIGSFILKATNYMEMMEAITSATTEAEMMTVMMDNMSGMMILFLYEILIGVLIISGIVLLIINRKKFKLTAKETDIKKGQRFKTVILNVGVILYSVFLIAVIVLQLIV